MSRRVEKRSEPGQPAAPREWLVAAYQPVTMFSLRMTHATSKGGKTLVLPTPYAVKMALLDVCFRRFPASEALTRARSVFDWIKAADVRVRPPKHCLVNNTFVKVLDWNRDGVDPFRQTIAYRELAFYGGDELLIAIAVDGLDADKRRTLSELFAHINSLGKRGGFVQFTVARIHEGDLPWGFTVSRAHLTPDQIMGYLVTHALDDFGGALIGAKDGFDRVSTYGTGTIKLGEHRTLTATAIPYTRKSSSRHFTWYERTENVSSPADVNLPIAG
jgi:hypothetical protein